MRVTIKTTINVNDTERLAINHHYGAKGKANYSVTKDFLEEDFCLDTAVKRYYEYKAAEYAKLAGEDASE